MHRDRPLIALLLPALLVAAPSCDRGRPPAPASAAAAHRGVTALGAGAEVPTASGQTIYVPTYSYVNITDAARPFNLAVTLSVRNADPKESIVVTAVRYHGADGHLVRDYLPRPVRVAPWRRSTRSSRRATRAAGRRRASWSSGRPTGRSSRRSSRR